MSAEAPYIAPAIVEYLARLFPLALPTEADSDRSIWVAVGVQKVVKKIKQVSDEQQQNVLQQK